MAKYRTPAFTLIELLVVITIIVVLLALLTPALDKAIYQAELTVCAARLDGIATGMNSYAVGHKRSYPYRANVLDSDDGRPGLIRVGFPAYRDDRPPLKGYVSLDSLMDPFGADIDIENHLNDTWLYIGYQVWAGWRYKPSVVQAGGSLLKLGDRLTWSEGQGGGVRTRSFTVLAGDWETINQEDTHVYGGHPDRDGVLTLQFHQDQDFLLGVSGAGVMDTWSLWRNDDTPARGPWDRNFVYADGSVARFDALIWGDSQSGRLGDERVQMLAEKVNEVNNDFTSLPTR